MRRFEIDGLRLPELPPRAMKSFFLGAPPSLPPSSPPPKRPAQTPPEDPGEERKRFPSRPGGEILLGVDTAGEDVFWRLGALPNAFLCAFGSSGSGKTVALNAIAANSTLPCILFDFHGDLKSGRGETYRPLSVADLSPLEIVSERGPRDQAIRFIESVGRAVPQLGHVQRDTLKQAALAAYKGAGVLEDSPRTWTNTPDVQGLIRYVEKETASQRGLIAALDSLFSGGQGRQVNVSRLISTGGRCDFTALTREAQVLAAETLLSQIWAAIQQAGPVPGGRYRVMVIVDESVIIRGSHVLEQLLRESRKFGLSLVLASQAPSDLPGAVVNNTAAILQMKLGDPSEARIAARILEDATPKDVLGLSEPGQAYFRAGKQLSRFRVLPAGAAERER